MPTTTTRRKSFDEWLHAVDAQVQARVGVSYLDLPDYCYADAYDDGRSPSEVARAAIRAAQGEE